MPWWSQESFIGGINEKPEEAAANQVRDARNVWAPDGRLETRPGYRGVISQLLSLDILDNGANVYVVKENNATTPRVYTTMEDTETLDLGGLSTAPADGTRLGPDRIYVGTTVDPSEASAFKLNVTTANTNIVRGQFDYYNGSIWLPLRVTAGSGEAKWPRVQSDALFDTTNNQLLNFVPPNDWATLLINGDTCYWIRITLIDPDNDSAPYNTISVGTTLDNTGTTTGIRESPEVIKGAFSFQFINSRKYFVLQHRSSDTTQLYTTEMDAMPPTKWSCGASAIGVNGIAYTVDEPASAAVVSAYDDAFVAYNHRVLNIRAEDQPEDSNYPGVFSNQLATVETASDIVGGTGLNKEEFHPDYIVQLGAFPRAQYLEFFNGQLWAANLLDAPYMVRWSGPDPAYKVWPVESFEQLVEDDDSPITGMKAFGEHLAVFKQDSIWRMAFGGLSGLTGLNTYIPVKVPGGIGTVSNTSIADINGVLMFLAEDGVYAFDGVNKPTKISDPLDALVDRIGPARQRFSAGVHWRKKNMYLLAVAIDGSDHNNIVLGYDYSAGSWWVWDNINAQVWMRDENYADEEAIYFGDDNGFIHILGKDFTDYGTTIDDWVELHRVGLGDWTEKAFREIRVMGQGQDIDDMSIDLTQDDGVKAATSATLDWRSSAEPKVGGTGITCTTAGTYSVYNTRRDSFKLRIREDCEWLGVKVTNETDKRMRLDKIALKVFPKGMR